MVYLEPFCGSGAVFFNKLPGTVETINDNPKENLSGAFKSYANKTNHKPHGNYGTVYVLTNFNSTLEEDLHRIYTLRDLGFAPDVRIYNKPSAPREIKMLQRWVNNKIIFKSCNKFEDYDPKKGRKR